MTKRAINGVETIQNDVSKPPRATQILLKVACDTGQNRGL
jgi:hypothetical protein